MDSLLANYASFDDEDGEAEDASPPTSRPELSFISTALPPPKSSSLFSSLPPPQISSSSPLHSSSSSFLSSLPLPRSPLHNHLVKDYEKDDGERYSREPPSSIFSSLPPPKTSSSSTLSALPAPKSQPKNFPNKPCFDQRPKKVVHFTPPLNPSMLQFQYSDEDDEEDKEKKARRDTLASSTPKALSAMLPAPKNSLCIAPAQSLGASRRSCLQADAPSANYPQESKAVQESGNFADHSEYAAEQGVASGYETYGSCGAEQGVSVYEDYTNNDGNWTSEGVNPAAFGSVDSTYVSVPAITGWEEVHGSSFDYGNCMDTWANSSGGTTTSKVPDIGRISGKRGRTDIATEILEVNQDELMKNRPREDQVKLTGIAFGPAYKPSASAKGKPSKLQKRKHQIGSLYYDMRQKELELAERRSRGLLTKSETQAKYGW